MFVYSWKANVSIQRKHLLTIQKWIRHVYWHQSILQCFVCRPSPSFSVCLVWRSKVRAHIIFCPFGFCAHLHTVVECMKYEYWVFSQAKLIFIFILLVRWYFSFYFALSVGLCAQAHTIKTHCISTCNATRFDSDQTCLWHHTLHPLQIQSFNVLRIPYYNLLLLYRIVLLLFYVCVNSLLSAYLLIGTHTPNH